MPGPDKLFPLLDFSDDYLDWGRSEWGGSGNYLWAFSDDLTWVKSKHTWKFGFIVQEDHYDGYGWHTAAGTYNFNRGATAGFLANGTLDATGASGNAFASFLLGEVAVVRNHDQPLRLRPVALLLRLRPGRLARQQQAHGQLRRALRVHAADVGGPLPGRLLELQPGPAQSRPPAAAWAPRSSPARAPGRTGEKSLYDAWPWGFSPRLGVVYSRERGHRRAIQRGARLRLGEEHRRQLALATASSAATT